MHLKHKYSLAGLYVSQKIPTNQGNSIKGTQWVLRAGEASAADRSSHDLCADHYFPCKNPSTNFKFQISNLLRGLFHILC